jgi:tetratricopeptide (TPR) repeat protein
MAQGLGVALLALLANGAGLFAQPAQWGTADTSPWDTPRARARAWSAHRTVDEPLDPAGGTMRGSRPIASSAVISLHELKHQVPKKALSEFEKGRKAESKGEVDKAIEHFARAVVIDPEFHDALNDLGVNYIRLNQIPLAIEHLTKAVAIAPRTSVAHANLALALMMADKFEDAERAARQGVRGDASDARAPLLLGASLVMQRKFTAEAEQSLRKAAPDFPQASLMLVPFLVQKGEIQAARDHLDRYLAEGDGSCAEIAKTWKQKLDGSGPQTASTPSQLAGAR